MMSLAKLKRLTATAEAFNERAQAFGLLGQQLMAQREAMVAEIREIGLLKDEAEGMVAKIKCDVAMPDSEGEGGAPDDADQAPPSTIVEATGMAAGTAS